MKTQNQTNSTDPNIKYYLKPKTIAEAESIKKYFHIEQNLIDKTNLKLFESKNHTVRKTKTYILFCAQCSHKNLKSAILLRPKTITSVCSYCGSETAQRVIGYVSAILPKNNLLLHYTHKPILRQTAQTEKQKTKIYAVFETTETKTITLYSENSFKFESVKTVKP